MNFWTFLDRNGFIVLAAIIVVSSAAVGSCEARAGGGHASGCGLTIDLSSKDGGAP